MLCKCFTNASQSRHVKLCQTSYLSKEWWNLCKTMQNEHSYKSYSAPRGQLRCPGDETVDRVPCGFECPRVPVNPQDKKILLKNWRNREEIVCNYMESHGESWRSEGCQEDAINCHHHSVCNLGIFSEWSWKVWVRSKWRPVLDFICAWLGVSELATRNIVPILSSFANY